MKKVSSLLLQFFQEYGLGEVAEECGYTLVKLTDLEEDEKLRLTDFLSTMELQDIPATAEWNICPSESPKAVITRTRVKLN